MPASFVLGVVVVLGIVFFALPIIVHHVATALTGGANGGRGLRRATSALTGRQLCRPASREVLMLVLLL
jgi:hypothetical protein